MFHPFILIFIGAMIYVFAAYGHINMQNWTFSKGLMFAIPLVLLEYTFSVPGNKHAHDLGYTGTNILLLTMCFYFIGMYGMEKFYLKEEVKNKDFISFGLILSAFYLSIHK